MTLVRSDGASSPIFALPSSSAGSSSDLVPQSITGKPPPLQSASPPLPTECATIQMAPGNTVIFCRPVPESVADKIIAAAPSLAISLVALALSAYAAFYNKKKDSRARDLSVKDDYWLRKIVSPSSIEPFVLLSSSVLSDLPDVNTPSQTQESLKDWYQTTHKAVLKLVPGFRTLELLDPMVLAKVQAELEAFEDLLADYVGDLDAHLGNPEAHPPPLKAATIAGLSNHRLALLRAVQSHQNAL